MSCKGFAKRVLPFLLTFAVGLFIASFFVSIAAPNFQFPNRSSRKKHREYDRQRELEIQRLRDENLRLRNQQALVLDNADFQNLKYAVPPPPPIAPPAPLVPQRVK
jgi:hypothetical protein